jgi:hypothetical protein
VVSKAARVRRIVIWCTGPILIVLLLAYVMPVDLKCLSLIIRSTSTVDIPLPEG